MHTNYLKKLNLLTGVVLLLMTAGCKKFLDQRPITEVSTDVVFSDVPNAYKALAGVYSRLVGDAGYGIRVSLYYPLDTDEMQGPTGALDNDRRDIARYSASPGNAQITNPFNQMFQGIEYANICIDNIPKMAMYNGGTDQEKKQLKRMYGEALTLRAQFYFEAIRNWGDLPAHFAAASSLAVNDPFPSRTNRDSLYNHLIDDLKTAEDLVPWRNEVASIGDTPDERITKGTVKGLRARLALYRGGYSLRQNGNMQRSDDYLQFYQIARVECNEIITSAQHSLNPNFKSLWKDQVCGHAVVDPNGELMFQASGIGLSGAEDNKLGYYNGPTVNALGNKSINVLPSYFYLFDSTDLRRDVTCAPYNVNADGVTKTGQAITAINDGKYRRDWITNPTIAPTSAIQYLGLKWQILRYSDVLLMFAEAENELNGPTAAAIAAWNAVSLRGHNGNATLVPTPPADKTGFFKLLVKERALELGGEGIRKYDLIRWNLLAAAIAETKVNLLKMSTLTPMIQPSYMSAYPIYSISTILPIAMYYKNNSTADDVNLWANSFYRTAPTSTPTGTTKVTWLSVAINTTALSRYATGFSTGKGELLPIPQPVRDANFNFSQNPRY
ncbi:MAG: RagB/SusD family nutrient uptake outer membrane protein [Ferruginibacter sp.]